MGRQQLNFIVTILLANKQTSPIAGYGMWWISLNNFISWAEKCVTRFIISRIAQLMKCITESLIVSSTHPNVTALIRLKVTSREFPFTWIRFFHLDSSLKHLHACLLQWYEYFLYFITCVISVRCLRCKILKKLKLESLVVSQV